MRRNYSGPAALTMLLASGPVSVVIPGLGTALLVAAIATSGIGVYVAWRRSMRLRAWLLSSACLCLSVWVLLRILLAPVGVDSRVFAVKTDRGMREYRLYRPSDVPRDRRLPVVIVLHGLMQRAHTIEKISGLDQTAEAGHFLVVYPEGFRRSWNDSDRTKPATRAGIDDIGFIRTLIGEVADQHGADLTRVYVVGFSNGGFLTLQLACELSNLIAGIAVVGAGTSDGFPKRCDMREPVSALFIVGREDPLVPWRTFGASAKRWAARLGCDDQAKSKTIPDAADDGTRVEVTSYPVCPAGSSAVQMTIEGGGHTWPEGAQYLPEFLIGRTSHDIDASTEIWSFLHSHTRDGTP